MLVIEPKWRRHCMLPCNSACGASKSGGAQRRIHWPPLPGATPAPILGFVYFGPKTEGLQLHTASSSSHSTKPSLLLYNCLARRYHQYAFPSRPLVALSLYLFFLVEFYPIPSANIRRPPLPAIITRCWYLATLAFPGLDIASYASLNPWRPT